MAHLPPPRSFEEQYEIVHCPLPAMAVIIFILAVAAGDKVIGYRRHCQRCVSLNTTLKKPPIIKVFEMRWGWGSVWGEVGGMCEVRLGECVRWGIVGTESERITVPLHGLRVQKVVHRWLTPCFCMETLVRCRNMLSSSVTLLLYLTVQNRQNPRRYLREEQTNNASKPWL